ncbi:MAG: restriction endonuclease subunit S [Colwellia sp.]
MVDINKLITENISVWSSAVVKKSTSGRGASKKIDLIGLHKLRELILDLAVHGKLVPQIVNAEPASVLLKNIEKEKKQLLQDKKIKKQKKLPPLGHDERPFELPNSWEWCRIGDITNLMSGKGFQKSEYSDSGARLFQIANVSLGYPKWEVENFMPLSYLNDYPELQLAPGDVLIALNRPLLNRRMKICILSENDMPAILYQRVGKFNFYEKTINTKFFYYYMQSPLFIDKLNDSLQGSDQPFINLSQLINFVFPLPPAKQQKLIVSKVDELMELCDQLEQRTESGIDARQLLVKELLSTLINSTNAAEFKQSWTRVTEYFDLLFSTEDSVEQLKQTILQLAVKGKLVPQDPKDEHASKLLERISKEKEQLIKDKVIKKQKALPDINIDDIEFEIPKSWTISRLGEITNYGVCDKAELNDVEDNCWVLELEDVEKITSKLIKKVRVEERQFKSSKNKFITGDVIYGKLRPYLDKVLVADECGVCSTEMIPIRAYSSVLPEFLKMIMKTPYFVDYANNSTHGMNLPRMGTDKARLAPIIIAPIKEQQRIVSKVDALFKLCNNLKKSISVSEDVKVDLSSAIVDKALR